MDSIRVAKVSGVICSKPASTTTGTLHLTAHHIIYNTDGAVDSEMWVPYPLISLVTRLPQTLHGLTPLSFRCRTFETFTLSFSNEQDALDVFDSVKELTVTTSVTQLYAYNYEPNPPLPTKTGWSLYSPREEFARMGVGSRTKAWRFTDINKDFTFCPTYPARLVVPAKISDTTLAYACKYRSRARIPTLSYLHWANFGTITRSSQPMVGLTNNRSVQDEKLIEAIFQSHYFPDSPYHEAKVYGATATNLITDARPTTNAMATFAKGAGTENMEYYKDAKKVYLGVDNIHVMRDSLTKVVEVLCEADANTAALQGMDPSRAVPPVHVFLDRAALRKSGWLRYISALLEGTLIVVRNIHVNSSHVLIHCSDGWDRTAQLSSLSQICLDPFYRTMKGLEILIEKDWLSFGHRFMDRCGHLSSDKFFLASGGHENAGGADAAQAFLASVQNKFTPQHHLKETSPVFHQFLECIRQIQRQYPSRFEFNQRFLERLHHHLYSCQFGSFLHNNERERRLGDGDKTPYDATVSAWDWFNSPEEMAKNKNDEYDPSLDDPKSGDMGVLFPNPKDVRFWHELYGRTDEEMNGRILTSQAVGAEVLGPIDGNEEDPVMVASEPFTHRSPSTPPTVEMAPQTNRGSTLATSVSLPSLNMKYEEPPSTQRESLAPSGTVRSHTLQTHRQDAESPEAGPSSPGRLAKQPRFPDAFTSGGLKSMWGKFSSNASAALSNVYGGVAKELSGIGSGSSELGGELQTTDSTGTPWSLREERLRSGRAVAVDMDDPWASPPARVTVPSSPSIARRSSYNTVPETPPRLPLDPTVEPTTFDMLSHSSSRRLEPLDVLAPSVVPLSPSRRPSTLKAESPPPMKPSMAGQQSDPLGVGWL
ncbi:protein phosphatase [Hysterangium stoloniferum]|nr:protein phosphatase [Hysterangium stoloniferum]